MDAAAIATALEGTAYDGPFLAASAELLAGVLARAAAGDNTAAALWLRVTSSARPMGGYGPADGASPFGSYLGPTLPGGGRDEVGDEIARSFVTEV